MILAAHRLGHGRRTFLLRRSTRARIKELNASNPRHFHHLVEIGRRQKRLLDWFNAEKERLRYGHRKDAALLREATKDVKLEALLQKRDEKIISMITRIAGVSERKHGAAIQKVANEVGSQYGKMLEGRVFMNAFFQVLRQEGFLRETDLKALRTAFGDWLNAIQVGKALGQHIG